MPKDDSFKEYVMDQLAEFGGIDARPMFGGWGIYKDGIVFAIISDSAIYFKTAKDNTEKFKERGSKAFSYTKKGKKQELHSYWELPEEILENPDELYNWVMESANVSLKSKK